MDTNSYINDLLVEAALNPPLPSSSFMASVEQVALTEQRALTPRKHTFADWFERLRVQSWSILTGHRMAMSGGLLAAGLAAVAIYAGGWAFEGSARGLSDLSGAELAVLDAELYDFVAVAQEMSLLAEAVSDAAIIDADPDLFGLGE